jgi:hypothetical protein
MCLIEPPAAFDELSPKIAQVRYRPAEARQTELRENT